MDFLAPLFAAVGVTAATIPIVLHMLRRAPTERMPFSLVRFLKPSRPKMTRRSRIEHWPLMLLRILALVLIGLAFARPFQRRAATGGSPEGDAAYIAVLIDGSASMRRDGIRDDVQDVVRQVVESAGENDLVSVSVYSRQLRTVLSAEKWAQASAGERDALVTEVLESYEPDWMGTETGVALRQLADELAQENALRRDISQRQIILISDFQEGSNLDQLQTASWPASVEIDLRIVNPSIAGNAGITWFPDETSTDRTRVRVTNAGDSSRSQYLLQPFDETGAAVGALIPVEVQAGQRRTVLLPKVDEETSRLIAGVELLEDPYPFDNVVDLPTTGDAVVRVAHIGAPQKNDPSSMRYYLQRALDGATGWKIELIDALQPDQVALPIPEDVRLIVATDVVPEGLLPSIQECLKRDGVLVVAISSPEMASSLAGLLPTKLTTSEADVADYAMLGQIDFDNQLFAAFSDAKFSDFSSIRFFNHRLLDFPPEDERWNVVARFDSGDPAIVEVDTGEPGRILLLSSGWHPRDSQWALSTRFPPMINGFVASAVPDQSNFVLSTVGDSIQPGLLTSSDDWSVGFPDGTSIDTEQAAAIDRNLPSQAADESAPSVFLDQPGRYTIRFETDDGPSEFSLIVGLSPAESRTESLPAGQLQIMGVDAENLKTSLDPQSNSEDNGRVGQLSVSELEAQQKLWRWFLLSGLACLLIESILATVIASNQVGSEA